MALSPDRRGMSTPPPPSLPPSLPPIPSPSHSLYLPTYLPTYGFVPRSQGYVDAPRGLNFRGEPPAVSVLSFCLTVREKRYPLEGGGRGGGVRG